MSDNPTNPPAAADDTRTAAERFPALQALAEMLPDRAGGEQAALALAEIAQLRADRVLTPTDQAVLDAADECERTNRYVRATLSSNTGDWPDDYNPQANYFQIDHDAREALYEAVRTRRAAVGGSVPTDPPLPAPDESMCQCPSHAAGGTCWRFPANPKEQP